MLKRDRYSSFAKLVSAGTTSKSCFNQIIMIIYNNNKNELSMRAGLERFCGLWACSEKEPSYLTQILTLLVLTRYSLGLTCYDIKI